MEQWHNQQAQVIALDGAWNFSLGDQHGSLHVPGTWEAQGYPPRLEAAATYTKTVEIPLEWRSQRVQLQFDAVSYHIEAHINGVLAGSHDGMWTPFAFDITEHIRFGEQNTITLTVVKPGEQYPIRENLTGFLPDVCIPFGGVWQSARLAAFSGAALSHIWVFSDVTRQQVQVRADLHHAEGATVRIRILTPDGREAAVQREPAQSHLDATLTLPDIRLWQMDDPALYTAEITLESGGIALAQVQRPFGFRVLSKQGEQLLFNGAPVLLRGILNWGWYPEILCPAPDEATIRDEFRRVRELGYNMVKLCLYVPSRRYFEIADEEGMLLWLELPMWLPEVTDRLRQNAPREYQDILEGAHTHPSIILYSLGCELDHQVDAGLMEQLNRILRTCTHDVLACDNSGSGEAYGGLAFDYADFNDYHFYCDLHYFSPLVHHFQRDWRSPRPWIFGEFCDADDYRDLEEYQAVKGEYPWWLTEKNPIHPLRVLAYSEQGNRMSDHNLGFSGQDLQRISRQQSYMIRKSILEKVRSHSAMGGYVVTSIRETPLAASSMFDLLGRFKYAPEDFRTINADTVLVLEQGRARRWTYGGDRPAPIDRQNRISGETLDYRIVLSHSGAPLPASELHWSLLSADQQPVQSGSSAVQPTASGSVPQEIARFNFTAPTIETPQEYTLTADLKGAARNQWPIWIYPAVNEWSSDLAVYDPAGSLSVLDDLIQAAAHITRQPDFSALQKRVLLTSILTPQIIDHVEAGGRVIVLQHGAGSLPAHPCPFWREAVKLLYPHPILEHFPHKGFADAQFYHLATDWALDTTALQADLPHSRVTPILRRLDSRLFTLHDYLVEVNLGSGRILASSLRFAGGVGDQVANFKSNTAGRYLLNQIISYMETPR